MVRAITAAICFGLISGTVAKFGSWLVLEWALARFPQDDVIAWATLVFGVLTAAFIGSRAYEYFYPDDEDDDDY